jgi:signal transduction histidine kinase
MARHTTPETPQPHAPDALPLSAPDQNALPPHAAALHDLANLVDAALRCAGAGRRAGDPFRALAGVEAALEQITDLLPALGHETRPRRHHASVRRSLIDAADLLRPLAAEHAVELHLDADAAPDSLAAPGLTRVLADAVRNAIESIGVARCTGHTATGHILISAGILPGGTQGQRSLRIAITDDGAGPPAALTDPFRAGSTTKPTQPAARGLGLAVARLIVRRLRGTIELLPAGFDTPGRPGAVLQITLPLESLTHVPPDATPGRAS